MNLGKILSTIARKVLIPAVAKIAANPGTPLSVDSAKDALTEAAEQEALRQVGKGL